MIAIHFEGLHLEANNIKQKIVAIADFATNCVFDTFHQIEIEIDFIQFDSFQHVLFLSSDHFFAERWNCVKRKGMKRKEKEKQQNITKYIYVPRWFQERKQKKNKRTHHEQLNRKPSISMKSINVFRISMGFDVVASNITHMSYYTVQNTHCGLVCRSR